MRFNVLVWLSLTCLCLALAQTTYDDCCLKYVKGMGRKTQNHVVQYRMQVTDGGCNIPAVIFTMRKGREYCTDPRHHWVRNLMNKIDHKDKTKKDHKKSMKHQRPYKG